MGGENTTNGEGNKSEQYEGISWQRLVKVGRIQGQYRSETQDNKILGRTKDKNKEN